MVRYIAIIVCSVGLLFAPTLAHAQPERPTAPQPHRPINTGQWVVGIAEGAQADAVAARLGATNLGQIGSLNYYLFDFADSSPTTALARSPQVTSYHPNQVMPVTRMTPPDPLYPQQWHLTNTGQGNAVAGNDANVLPAWNAGYTGAGVDIGIVEDNFQMTHPDFAAKYDGAHSIIGPVTDEEHATSAAGVAAADDDGSCGVGAAYNARVQSLTWRSDTYSPIFGGYPTTDAAVARAWTQHYDVTDIYSNSWGYLADTVVQPINPLIATALADGVTNGRGGLGAIYVIAAGNGRTQGAFFDDGEPFNEDDTNDNGMLASRYMIVVGASSADGDYSGYSTAGAGLLVNAPSNGSSAGGFMAIPTTDLLGGAGYNNGNCTTTGNDGFGGTSSATPLVAGVIALMLEANPTLTWRDVQHILVRTATQTDANYGGWVTNGAGYTVSHDYGHGRVNAHAAVTMAETWTNVKPEVKRSASEAPNAPIPDGGGGTGVPGTPLVRTLSVPGGVAVENVEVMVNATHPFRGDLSFVLTSPSGTQSTLLPFRDFDLDANMNGWKLRSTHFWGEDSGGEWTLTVADHYDDDPFSDDPTGTLDSWELHLYGTEGLAAPLNLQATTTEAGITLNWSDPNPNEEIHIIERGTSSEGLWTQIGVVDANVTTFVDADVACGETWFYRVRAAEGGVPSAWSNVTSASTAPCVINAPTDVSLSHNTGTASVDVTWTDNATNETAYTVERLVEGDPAWTVLTTTLPADTTAYTDGGATCATAYFYRVRATNEKAASDYTPPNKVVTPNCLPNPPSEVVGTYTSGTHSVSLTWADNSPDETGFVVERRKLDADVWQRVATPAADATAFMDDTVTCDQDYVYRVRYVNDTGQSVAVASNVVVTDCAIFADVPSANQPPFFEAWIEDFYQAGITQGCNAGTPGVDLTYCPDEDVTRGEMAVFIMRALQGPSYTPTGSEGQTFTDVPSPNQPPIFEAWIEEFFALGLTTGCNNGTAGVDLAYCPDLSVTRGEMAVFVMRALEGAGYAPAGNAEKTFADVPSANQPPTFEPWIEEFYNRGITTGCNNGTAGVDLAYCPETPVTRGQMAVFILRAFDDLPDPNDP